MASIPHVAYAFVNGSGTWGCNFPEDCEDETVSVLETDLVFDTPHGETVPCKLLRFAAVEEGSIAKDVLSIPMHGWRYGGQSEYTRTQCSDQVFWVLEQAGVKMIIGQSSVGALNHLLEPYDIVVIDDFIEDRVDRGTAFVRDVRMREALCPALRHLLIGAAEPIFPRVMRRGTYVCFEGPRLETPAEIERMRQWGGDVVSQSLAPEVYYARGISAHYASIHIVSNYAEGVNEDWDTEDMVRLYQNCGPRMGRVLLNAMKRVGPDLDCRCERYMPRGSFYDRVWQR
jgi:5'-methylthioadenosine phosphorylase